MLRQVYVVLESSVAVKHQDAQYYCTCLTSHTEYCFSLLGICLLASHLNPLILASVNLHFISHVLVKSKHSTSYLGVVTYKNFLEGLCSAYGVVALKAMFGLIPVAETQGNKISGKILQSLDQIMDILGQHIIELETSEPLSPVSLSSLQEVCFLHKFDKFECISSFTTIYLHL